MKNPMQHIINELNKHNDPELIKELYVVKLWHNGKITRQHGQKLYKQTDPYIIRQPLDLHEDLCEILLNNMPQNLGYGHGFAYLKEDKAIELRSLLAKTYRLPE